MYKIVLHWCNRSNWNDFVTSEHWGPYIDRSNLNGYIYHSIHKCPHNWFVTRMVLSETYDGTDDWGVVGMYSYCRPLDFNGGTEIGTGYSGGYRTSYTSEQFGYFVTQVGVNYMPF